jgi:hypothetical protein
MHLMTDEERKAYEEKCRTVTLVEAHHDYAGKAAIIGVGGLPKVAEALQKRMGYLGLAVLDEYEVMFIVGLIDKACPVMCACGEPHWKHSSMFTEGVGAWRGECFASGCKKFEASAT